MSSNSSPSTAQLVAIYLSPERNAPMHSVDMVEVAIDGLVGDRHRDAASTRQISLIARESIEAVAASSGVWLTPDQLRINLYTHDIVLEDCVGKAMQVGTARLEITEMLPACRRLEIIERVTPEDLAACHKFMARVIEPGQACTGDPLLY